MDMQRLTDLITQYLDGYLSEADRVELESLLLADPKACERFWEQVQFHEAVHHVLEQQSVEMEVSANLDSQIMSEVVEEQLKKQKQLSEESARMRAIAEQKLMGLEPVAKAPKPALQTSEPTGGMIFSFGGVNVYRGGQYSTGLRIRLDRLAAAAVIAFVLVIGYLYFHEPPQPQAKPFVVARVTQTMDARWNLPIENGSQLVNDAPVQLINGFAELTFNSGAKVVLEAPCRFVLKSDNTMRLSRGKLVAYVPPRAKGFTIISPNARLVDYGTEVARRNAPVDLTYDATATAEQPNLQAIAGESINLSANLDLLNLDDNVLAIHAMNVTSDDDDFLIDVKLTAEQIGTSDYRYMPTPTPGQANAPGYVGFVGDTSFDVDRGFYNASFPVTITSATPDAIIRFTTDGSRPSETHGSIYTDPITVTTTTTLRAFAYKQNWLSTNVDTQTYIFVDDVAQQPSELTHWPDTWGTISQGTVPADYEMDPRVVNSTLPGYSVPEALLDIPTMSITMPRDDFISLSSGIYTHPLNRGDAWEKEISLELIYPDGTKGFQYDAQIEMHGNSSRNPYRMQKHSFRVTFKEEFGPPKLNFPLFENAPVETFNKLVLRGMFTDSWGLASWSSTRYRPNDSQYIRDVWMKQSLTLRVMRDDGAAVYLNGSEVYRTNLPGTVGESTLTYQTPASVTVGGSDESYFFTYTFDAGDLVTGDNVIAVELHQKSPTSSDLSFDLELTASGTTPVVPIVIDQFTTIKARALHGGQWSALNEAAFSIYPPADVSNLRITELHYNPLGATQAEIDAGFNDGDLFEFIELLNISSTDTIDLTGVRFDAGVDFTFAPGMNLAPGQRIVVVSNESAFEMRYGIDIAVIAGEFENNTNLANGGEPIGLVDAQSQTIVRFNYEDGDDPGEEAWPTTPDGAGPSLVAIDTEADLNLGENWRPSYASHGTPGEDETAAPLLESDFNEDGIVDVLDLGKLASHWKQPVTSKAEGDTNGDGIVDVLDLGKLASQWKQTTSPAPATPLAPAAAVSTQPAILTPGWDALANDSSTEAEDESLLDSLAVVLPIA